MFTPVTASPPSDAKGLGLAPLAVKPQFQKQSLGSQLVREGLRACAKLGYDFVVLLGDPKYYHRFGFQSASNFSLRNEYGVDEEFMALELKEGCLHGKDALIKYAPEFSDFNL